jgi:hypothetical protein
LSANGGSIAELWRAIARLTRYSFAVGVWCGAIAVWLASRVLSTCPVMPAP